MRIFMIALAGFVLGFLFAVWATPPVQIEQKVIKVAPSEEMVPPSDIQQNLDDSGWHLA